MKLLRILSTIFIALSLANCGNVISDTKKFKSAEDYLIPDKITADTRLSFETLDLKSFDKDKKDYKEEIKSWFKYFLKKHSKIVIDKVIISSTGEQIDQKGIGFIKPDYSNENETVISIKGKFNDDVIAAPYIFFKNEPNLLQLSYTSEDNPKTKILIDDSILLEPVSATRDEIKVKVKTHAVSDYYLLGLHKLSIISKDKEITDTLIRFGNPETPKTSLSPVIEEIKILKVKDLYKDKDELAFKVAHDEDDFKKLNKETPIAIKIKGKNFPVFYKFSFSKIDSRFSWGHSTVISKDTTGNIVYESIIHIPDYKEFQKLTSHVISYSTPFGTAIRRF